MGNKGRLFIISGPSGVGKGTICQRLIEMDSNIVLSVSATERSPRAGEIDGESYFFVAKERFSEMIERDELLEWAQYGENRYGTPREPVEAQLARGKNVILEIDVQGAMQVKEKLPEAVTIFVVPLSEDVLLQRLRKRGTESDEQIKHRLARAAEEMRYQSQYEHIVISDGLEESVRDMLNIIYSK